MAEPIRPGDLSAEESGSFPSRLALRRFLSLGLVAIICLIAWRSGVDILGALEHMRRSNVWMMVAMIGVFIAARWFGGEILRQALLVLGHHIEKSEAFYITIIRTYASLLVPKAGYGAAGVYLKVQHGVDFAKSGSLLLPILLLQCTVIGPLGLASLFLLNRQYDIPIHWWWTTAFVITACFGASVLVVKTSMPTAWSGKVAHFLRRLGEAWRQISGNRDLVYRLLVLHAVLALLRAARLYFAFSAVVLDVAFLPALVASLLADIAFIVSPTPNNLGTREFTIGTFMATLPLEPALDAKLVLSAVFLDRIVTTLVVIIFAQIGLVRVTDATRQKDDSDGEAERETQKIATPPAASENDERDAS